MSLPVDNQSFQKGNLKGFTPNKTSRLVGVSRFHFNCRTLGNDQHRTTATVMPDEFGNCFARLDGEGMMGHAPSRKLTHDGRRHASSPPGQDLSAFVHAMTNNHLITGGEGATLSCPVTLPNGGAISFRWQFASTLVDPDDNEYAGFAGVRYLKSDGTTVAMRVIVTSHDLPYYHGGALMQTLDWHTTRFVNDSGSQFQGSLEWFVCSGHYHDQNQPAHPSKAKAYPCCLMIDHVAES